MALRMMADINSASGAATPITIAVDAMGGDHAPKEIIKGACEGVKRLGCRLILVGDEPHIQRYLSRLKPSVDVTVLHAPEFIDMGENPANAIRRKPNSSIVRCARLVSEGKAQAMVSAGSTGASMAVATLILKRVPGIDRPAIASIFPTMKGQAVVLDVGANVDCSVENLVQFASMGSIYSRDVMGVRDPRVGLLSIGEEPTKGNELTKAAYKALAQSDLNFIGNIEGGPLFEGGADVVVCDGFVGNVALKVAEGVAKMAKTLAIERLWHHPIYKLLLIAMSPGLRQLDKDLDCEEAGGAPLLGVNGIVVISHGNSKAKSITNAMRLAIRAHEKNTLSHIKKSLKAQVREIVSV